MVMVCERRVVWRLNRGTRSFKGTDKRLPSRALPLQSVAPHAEYLKHDSVHQLTCLSSVVHSVEARLSLLSCLSTPEILSLSLVCREANDLSRTRAGRLLPASILLHSHVSRGLLARADWHNVTSLVIGDQWFKLPTRASLPSLEALSLIELNLTDYGIQTIKSLIKTASNSLRSITLAGENESTARTILRDLELEELEELKIICPDKEGALPLHALVLAPKLRRLAAPRIASLPGSVCHAKVHACVSGYDTSLPVWLTGEVFSRLHTLELLNVLSTALLPASARCHAPHLKRLRLPCPTRANFTCLACFMNLVERLKTFSPTLECLNLLGLEGGDPIPPCSAHTSSSRPLIQHNDNLKSLAIAADDYGLIYQAFPNLAELHVRCSLIVELPNIDSVRIDCDQIAQNLSSTYDRIRRLHLRSSSHQCLREALRAVKNYKFIDHLIISSPTFKAPLERSDCLHHDELNTLAKSMDISNLCLRGGVDRAKSNARYSLVTTATDSKYLQIQDMMQNVM